MARGHQIIHHGQRRIPGPTDGRRDEIECDLDQPPRQLTPANIDVIRDHIGEIIRDGNLKAKKALFEALIEDTAIKPDNTVVPRFRNPTMGFTEGMATGAPIPDPLANYILAAYMASGT